MPLIDPVKQEPVDPNSPLPTKRRVVWELFEDVRVANTWLFILMTAMVFTLCIFSLVLVTIYKRPPYILSEDEGFVMWRNTEAFKLRDDMLSMYASNLLSYLLNMSPGVYDLTPITSLVHPTIIKGYYSKASDTAEDRLSSNRRQIFKLNDARRTFYMRQFPQYIQIVTQGEKAVYSEERDNAGNVRVLPNAKIVYMILLLDQQRPTPQNPWGLYTVGIQQLDDLTGQKVWSESEPLSGTKDLRGKVINETKKGLH